MWCAATRLVLAAVSGHQFSCWPSTEADRQDSSRIRCCSNKRKWSCYWFSSNWKTSGLCIARSFIIGIEAKASPCRHLNSQPVIRIQLFKSNCNWFVTFSIQNYPCFPSTWLSIVCGKPVCDKSIKNVLALYNKLSKGGKEKLSAFLLSTLSVSSPSTRKSKAQESAAHQTPRDQKVIKSLVQDNNALTNCSISQAQHIEMLQTTVDELSAEKMTTLEEEIQ